MWTLFLHQILIVAVVPHDLLSDEGLVFFRSLPRSISAWLQVLIKESGMESLMKTMCEHFPGRTVVIEQYMDMFGIKRNEDGTLLFPGHSDKRFPIARIRNRLAAYGWRGERLNKEVARIVAGPDILHERRDYSIIFPYGWEKKQLTRRCGECFHVRLADVC